MELVTLSGPGSSAAAPVDPGCEALAADGAVVRLRPVGPSDADALHALMARTSDRSLYLRFFGFSRTSAEGYVDRLVRPAGKDHGVLVALRGEVLVGVAGYELVSSEEAEVALLVEDTHQGEGIGTLLLEHLASRARRNGVLRFIADTLPQNHRMLQVFDRSGLERGHTLRSGVVDIGLVTTLDETALDASDERERLAGLNSLAPLFGPRSVAVIGAGRAPGGVGHEVVRNLLRGDFCGPVFPINPYAATIAGLPAYTSLGAVGQPVDLAVVAVPAAAVDAVVEDCGLNGVRVVVVLTAYPPELGDSDAGPSRRSLLRVARRHGIRVVGPNCLGVVNTDPHV
ncbi:MAG: GNAT family N-acetyltransferase, partial [Actinomycetes bacterium]